MRLTARPTNNFDGLRLAAAAAVVIGHAYVLTGAGPAPSVLGFTIHKLGVAVFFCISGYLIAGSWYRTRSAPRYLWHRLLRVIPALWVLILVTTFIVGPAVSRLSPEDYYRSPTTFEYLLNLTTAATYRLPGVFEEHVNPAVNGSLWTIGVEVACYLALLALAVLCRRFTALGFAVAALVFAVASLSIATKHGPLAGLADAAPVAVYFFVGALMKSLERSGTVTWRPVHAVFALAAWLLSSAVFPDGNLALSWLLLPLCVIPLGRASWPVLREGSRFGDISYGVYLWGFLVQQIVIQVVGSVDLFVNTALVLMITCVLAWLSCRLVEQPALSLKDWTPSARTRRVSVPTSELERRPS
ncbi:acyltransferase family protein [Microbacterium sp. NPDC008134]|uniref:acyltransferase family protein n=1 Tax=Microbacterium sp. NPDC008134 TaxID=3364183 RepID=UPI0036E102C1